MLNSAPCSWRYRQHVPAHALGPAVTNVCPGRQGRALEWLTLEEKFAWQRRRGRGFRQRRSLSRGAEGRLQGVWGQFVGAVCQELWQLFGGWDHYPSSHPPTSPSFSDHCCQPS